MLDGASCRLFGFVIPHERVGGRRFHFTMFMCFQTKFTSDFTKIRRGTNIGFTTCNLSLFSINVVCSDLHKFKSALLNAMSQEFIERPLHRG